VPEITSETNEASTVYAWVLRYSRGWLWRRVSVGM